MDKPICEDMLVGGLEEFSFFHWEFHDPNWLSLHDFSEGRLNHQPGRYWRDLKGYVFFNVEKPWKTADCVMRWIFCIQDLANFLGLVNVLFLNTHLLGIYSHTMSYKSYKLFFKISKMGHLQSFTYIYQAVFIADVFPFSNASRLRFPDGINCIEDKQCHKVP